MTTKAKRLMGSFFFHMAHSVIYTVDNEIECMCLYIEKI